MPKLELNFLGDMEVIRDGEVMALPPSKKTRALLAYLALNQRSFHREHLCELLWEIPDDPRGSLRWSLSKLRRLVDDRECPRIVADRANVSFDSTGVTIDVEALLALADNLGQVDIAVLEDAAGRWCGNFLEGLELANFYAFHSWCVVQRERVARAQAAVLRRLIELIEAPQALTHARTLATINPYDESSRALLITLLMAAGRRSEAEQQFQLGKRMLQEVGVETSGELYRALREKSVKSVSPAVRHSAPVLPVATDNLLIGRETEITRLKTLFATVLHDRRAQFVFVQGEPGIGKTHLLEALAVVADESGVMRLAAGAYESETLRPFALWIDGLRNFSGDMGADIFHRDNVQPDSPDNRNRLFEELSDFIARQVEQSPLLLIFDDLQWCDESSAAALHYIARSNRHRPLFGLLAARAGEVRDNAPVLQALRGLRRDGLIEDIKLGPLPEAAVHELIQSQAPCANSASLSRECGGNPLLAIELARAESAGENGGSLDELIRERLSRLDLDVAEALRWAAVLAPHIGVTALERVSGMDAGRIGEALAIAEQQAMLRTTDRGFQFRHDLIARAIYADIPPARRRVMHRRVAESLDAAMDMGRAADLAHHASQSGDAALAARAMVAAGRLCLRFFANDDALTLARNGLQFAEQLQGSERICLILELRDILLAAAPLEDWRQAAEDFAQLAEQALDCGAHAHARLGYRMASYVRWEHGHWTGAREESLQAERVARAGDTEQQIVGMAETAKCLALLERDLDQADAMLMEAQALAARRRFSHYSLSAALAMLRCHEDRLEEAEELFKEALALCKSAGDRLSEFEIHEHLAMIDFQRGAFDQVLARCDTLLALGDKLREGSEAPFARTLQALCRYAIDETYSELEDELEALRMADAKYRLSYILTRAALLDIQRNRPQDAVRHAAEALGYAEILERATEMVLAHLVLARAGEVIGDEAQRQHHLDALAAMSVAPVASWVRQLMAELLPGPRREEKHV